MSLRIKKILFFAVWLGILSIGPITILKVTPFQVATKQSTFLINFFQRITGLALFSLLTIQITLGVLMSKLTERLGGWIFKFHILEGVFIYSLILLHPLLFVLYNFKIKGVIDPFYVFTDLCVLCKGNLEYFYNFGRIAFWLLTVGVLAGVMRTQPWLQKHWRKFHVLNYVAFFSVIFHSFKVGSDTLSKPFIYFYWFAMAWISILVIYRIFVYFKHQS